MKKLKTVSHALIIVCLALVSWRSINVKTKVPEFTPEVLMKTLKDSGIFFPDIVWSQSALETGNWTSKIFVQNNNLFGMKQARRRPNTATGTRGGHATYQDWLASVKDYKLWQKSFKIDSNTTRERYYALLGRVYCKTPGYVTHVKKIVTNKAKPLEKKINYDPVESLASSDNPI